MHYYSDDEYTYVTYNPNKRPLKMSVLFIDSPESEGFVSLILRFIQKEASAPKHLAKMAENPPKYFALLERLSTLFCLAYSPTKSWGLTKPEIRGAIYFLVDTAIKAGDWPLDFPMTKTTFVQRWAGGGCGE